MHVFVQEVGLRDPLGHSQPHDSKVLCFFKDVLKTIVVFGELLHIH